MKAKYWTILFFVACAGALGMWGCAGNEDVPGQDGGTQVGPGSGGSTTAGRGGSGGASTGQGGTTTTGRGGSGGGGGAVTSGQGGSGGTAGTGGVTTGRGGSGGTAGTGGVTTGRGGSGGTAGTGGVTTGRGGSGGTTGTGGVTSQGGSGGGTTSCSLPTHSGNGSFTWYYFGQGTARDGNGFRTACGYYGTENGTADTIENVAGTSPANNQYFAAIPGQNGFDSKDKCGACVRITGQNGTQIIATIIDECPYGSDGGNTACQANAGGHLDLSKTAFDRLGYSVGNPNNTTWSYVPCPVSGNVKVRVKPSTPMELFIENTITAVRSVTMNGQTGSRTSYGAWHFGQNVPGGASLSITDIANRTINVTLPSNAQGTNQDIGQQFPSCN